MTASDVIAELEQVGIQLWEDDGKLRFRGPEGAMTPERRDLLVSRRDDVLNALRERDTRTVEPQPEARFEPFPLTDVQSAYLLGRRDAFEYGSVPCHAYGELFFDTLDRERLHGAWSKVVDRHDMLRTVLDYDGFQRVLKDPPEPVIDWTDVRGLSASDGEARLMETRERLSHEAKEVTGCPLYSIAVTEFADRAVLHFSIDFLIADYVSIYLLLDEFGAFYENPEADLPAPAISFRDYLRAERQVRQGPAYGRDRAYWLERLDDLPAAPELPMVAEPSRFGATRFTRRELQLDPATWSSLKQRAGGRRLSASNAVMAAYAEVLGRWSRHPRFTLDVTVLSRLPLHEDVGAIVGDFTSVDLLAVDTAAGGGFAGRARALSEQLFEDLDHRLFTGVEVIRELSRRRGPQEALMPVVFTSAIGLADVSPAAGPMRTRIENGISQTPQAWLDCQAMEQPDGSLLINWDSRDDVIPPAVLDDMFGTFETLLRALAAADAPWAADDPVALPVEQLARRAEVNDTARPLSTALLSDALVGQALARPEETAVVDAEAAIGYRALLARATAVAEALRAAGHKRGDRVGVVMDKSRHQVAAAVGVLLADGAYVPVDAAQPEPRRDQILTAAGVELVLSHSRSTAAVPGGCRRIDVDTLADATAEPARPQGSPQDSAYVIFTSGSTGTPKGVEVSHQAAVNTLDDVCRRFAVTGDDVVLGLSSLAFDLSVFDIFGVLGRGGTLVLPAPERHADPSHWAELVAGHRVSVLNTVPAQMMLLEEYLRAADTDCTSVRLAMMSGDWIPVPLPDAIRARIPGIELASLGGATEAAIWSIVHPIGEVDPAWPSIPYGKPLENQRFHVLDGALRARPELVVGDLYIAGAGLAEGYLGDEEKTARSFIRLPSGERAYRTGDLGRYLPDGTIEFIGRDDRQVKIRGHRVELAEVESALSADPEVNAAAVTTRGERNDRRLAAFVEPAGTDAPASPTDTALVDDVVAAGDAIREGVDVSKVVEFGTVLDDAALHRMVDVLRQSGLWPTTKDRHTTTEIMRTARVAPKHERLVRRWLAACVENGYLREDDDGYACLRLVTPDDVARAWAEVERLMPQAHDRPELVEYFKTASAHLPELMRDEQDPLRLLFPEGDLSIQEAAYMEGFLSRYLNRLATSTVLGVARRHRGSAPLRVLEIGAGVGGTSADTIPALDGENVRYSFTDVSQFFLNKGADTYGAYPWVDYAMFDFNEPFRDQGVRPNSVDVILCGNVMHYAKDARAVLRRMREALVPGGWLVFIETTRDNYQILTSMEFLFDATAGDFQDVRHGKDQTFIARRQWQDLLAEAGAETVYCLPDPADELAGIGMHVFAARFKQDRVAIDTEDLTRRLASRLPAEMIPSRFHVLDSLPLTGNGKVDRAVLAGWAEERDPDSEQSHEGEQQGAGELKQAIAGIYAEVLRRQDVGLDTNFYSLGGDSLLAAQVVTQLRESVPEAGAVLFDELLRELLNGASVQEVAAFLDDSTATAQEETMDQASYVLAGATEQIGNPVHVLINDGFGEGAERVGSELGERDPVIQVPMLAIGDIGETVRIEDLADTVVQELRKLSPGPFHLIGARGGGLLALTAAQQLTELGVPVCGLTLISSYPLPAAIRDEVFYEAMFLMGAGADPSALGYPGQTALGRVLQELVPTGEITTESLAALAESPDPELRSAASTLTGLAGRPLQARVDAIADMFGWPADDILGALRGTRALFNAAGTHTPDIYTGDVRLLVHRDEEPIWPTMAADMRAYWKDVCVGGLDVEQIPGSHFTCCDALTGAQVDLPEEKA
ncbi:non-ribosomal peptide synthetase [Streptomyces sp. WMMB 322]|uniref:non-ribosomal peptide synthetase n=1 Tax=Streptomyces sp. WMMB 322 TaxID=1286821 RepID=UPI0006E32111|nr:non-ribosomal peptide synthetase [Streptomyces sp. WMMB 322]SCK35077.1 pyochelin synthetase [Streptomyces sp. WMMB 322]